MDSQAIDDLIQHTKDDKHKRLEWIPNSKFSNIQSIQTLAGQKFSYAKYEELSVILLLLENNKCTPTFVKEFARIYSLPTHKYINLPNSMEFRRYKTWLDNRNRTIKCFTKYDDNYCLVADKRFLYYYSQYGFCSACGILRCSPVWCICGHKELSDMWTSSDKKLDEFIKKSQAQTNSANEAYLEWIPFDCLETDDETDDEIWCNTTLPTYYYTDLKLIPLDIGNETDDWYYDQVTYSIRYKYIMYFVV
jgi:hypothetical protein